MGDEGPGNGCSVERSICSRLRHHSNHAFRELRHRTITSSADQSIAFLVISFPNLLYPGLPD